jgi:hypothetical protein
MGIARIRNVKPTQHGSGLLPSRRDLMLGLGASSALAAAPAFAHREIVATGTVFEDRTGVGVRRPGDPGIADVLVSNGRDVVRTDDDGRWRMPVRDGDHVFVIKPSQWTCSGAQGAVPQFAYLHQPAGSPREIAYTYTGVAPTGALPTDIDFPLQRAAEGTSFNAILVTDSQPQTAVELQYFRDDIIGGVMAQDGAFAINHGDVMFDDLSLYGRYLRQIGATGIPWHHCPGNHDINFESPTDAFSRETWKRTFGPRHYAFQHGGATFIVLDNVHYFGCNPGSRNSGHYCGLIGREQLHFVRSLLAHIAPDALVVVSMHIPLVSSMTDASNATADAAELMSLLSGRPHTVSFAGHMHTTEHHYLGADKGFAGSAPHHHHILTAASGSWWGGPKDRRGIPLADSADGTPNGFHILSVDGNAYTTRFVPVPEKGSAQVRAVIDGPPVRKVANAGNALLGTVVPVDALASCTLCVNVFDGGPRTRVTFAIGRAGQPAMPMQRVTAPDPLTVRMFNEHRDAWRSWVEPVASSHLWKARLPQDLKPDTYRVTVRAIDEYGREHITHTVLEVVERTTPA